MNKITNILLFIVIGFFVWILYVGWIIFDSTNSKSPHSYSTKEFNKEFNKLFFNPNKARIVIDGEVEENPIYVPRIWQTLEAFDNLENSSSQREFKKEFEHLLSMYLTMKSLFTKEELAQRKDKFGRKVLEYSDFYKILNIYIDYLQKNSSEENKNMLNNIVDKNLKNFYDLMKNSDDFVEYLLSLNSLEDLFTTLNCSNNLSLLFKKYPIVESELFFEKLDTSQREGLLNWKDNLSLEKKKNIRVMKEVAIVYGYAVKIFDEIHARELIALRDGSKEAQKSHEEYIANLKFIKHDFSKEWKDLWHLTINKNILGKDENFILMISIPYVYLTKYNFNKYRQHKFINKEHQKFLNACNKSLENIY